MGAHVGVVAQALAVALRLGHPGQVVAVHQRQAHQFIRLVGQALQQGFGNVHRACAAEVTQPERREFGGQQVVAPLAGLAHIAPRLQLGQQAVAGAQGHVQLPGQQGQGNTFRLGGQVLQQGQSAVQCQTHGVSITYREKIVQLGNANAKRFKNSAACETLSRPSAAFSQDTGDINHAYHPHRRA